MRPGGGLAAAGDTQLAEDVGHVDAGRLGRDEQLGGYFPVAAPGRDQPEHLEFAFGEAELATPGSRVARRLALGRVVASQPDPGAPGEEGNLLGERVRAKFVGQRGCAAQPFRRSVAVAAGQRGLGRVQQHLAERVRLAEAGPRGGGLVPGGGQPAGLAGRPVRLPSAGAGAPRRRAGGWRARRPRQRSAGKPAGPGRTSLVSPRPSATVRPGRPPRRGAARRAPPRLARQPPARRSPRRPRRARRTSGCCRTAQSGP